MEVYTPEGWQIDYHEFFDEEPEFDEGVCVNLSEDLLQIHKGPLTLDVGFYRDHYRIMMVRDCDWMNPVRTQDCMSRDEAIRVIEQWMEEDLK